MDARRGHSLSPTANPTFAMELAGLCRLMRNEELPSPSPAAAHQQYPAIDFSRYPSLRRGLIAPSYTRCSPSFRASGGACASKRLRSDGGGALAAVAGATTGELLAALAGCRSPSSSSSSSSTPAPVNSPSQSAVTSRTGVERDDDVPEPSSSEDDDVQDDSADEEEWLARVDEAKWPVLERQQSGGRADPVDVVGRVVFQHILCFLGWRSLGTCLTVSGGWNKCAKANFLWARVCEEMWEGKIHVLLGASDPAIPRLQAFQMSMAEARRVRIESVDLCRWVWELHYKEHAGEYWRQLDPYYHGLPSMRRIFHEDGHIIADPMDQIWGGHECSWTLRKSRSRGGAPLVRINHWPPMVVTRTPNWGWMMENAWVVYTSTNIPTAAAPLLHELALLSNSGGAALGAAS